MNFAFHKKKKERKSMEWNFTSVVLLVHFESIMNLYSLAYKYFRIREDNSKKYFL